MTPDRREADLAAVEAFFRRGGIPHLVADERDPSKLPSWAIPAIGVVGMVLIATVSFTLPWWLVIAGTVVLLVAVYALVELGALQIFIHQGRPILDGLRDTGGVAVRALPPLLAVLLFLSLASETWRAFGRLEGWRYGSVQVAFGALSAVVLLVGLRREREALYAPEPGPATEAAARATPARALVEAGAPAAAPPLERLARINVAVALLVSLGVRVLLVGLVVSGAFIVFGLLIVDRALTAEWVGADPHVLLSLRLGGRELVLTEALVRVATTLGAFASLYFAAVALGDERNRREFLDDELERLGRIMAAWAYYRGALTMPSATYHASVWRSDSSSGV